MARQLACHGERRFHFWKRPLQCREPEQLVRVGFGRPRRAVTGQCASFDALPVWFRQHP